MNTAENRGKEREAGRQEAKEGQVCRREFADGVCLSELGMGGDAPSSDGRGICETH